MQQKKKKNQFSHWALSLSHHGFLGLQKSGFELYPVLKLWFWREDMLVPDEWEQYQRFYWQSLKAKESLPGLPRVSVNSKKIKVVFPLGKCTTRGQGREEYNTQKIANLSESNHNQRTEALLNKNLYMNVHSSVLIKGENNPDVYQLNG